MKFKETFVCSLLLVASCANNPHLLPQASLNFLSQNPPSSLSDIQESALCNEHLVFTVQFKHQSKTGCPYCQCQCGSTVNTSTGTSASADITSEHPPHDLCHLLILGKVDQMRCRGLENKLTDVLAPIPFKELHRATSSFGLQMFLLQTTHTISSFTTKLIFVSQLSATFNCAKLRFKLKRFKNMNVSKLACCMIIIRQE